MMHGANMDKTDVRLWKAFIIHGYRQSCSLPHVFIGSDDLATSIWKLDALICNDVYRVIVIIGTQWSNCIVFCLI
jgi:hypothetical protein